MKPYFQPNSKSRSAWRKDRDLRDLEDGPKAYKTSVKALRHVASRHINLDVESWEQDETFPTSPVYSTAGEC